MEIGTAESSSQPRPDPGPVTVVLDVVGMHCQSCAALIEETLVRDPGVHRAMVDLDAGRASVVFDPGTVSVSEVCAAVVGVGYGAVPVPAGDPAT
jgi:copper chaperone CopZ